ncbi:THUMP domain-containing class I SAM-dependent RNA methyltransferase [Sneathiella limimaris]|uniref:THUMP domain-containing class I SAM-dependent RNA methyltransferase n=1 Tax=Sneathiella limimaris TaxID=1964213 RepID=UPI00146F2C11|nr:class I SAM-dependent RNA methyltransferase [Sneathiella limimaris]
MTENSDMEILLVAVPGLETALLKEVQEKGFDKPRPIKGGITIRGDWKMVWRANLELRGASRILVRLGSFHAVHLAQLDKRARKFPWSETLDPSIPVKVEVSCKSSRIYHQKAAAERIVRALTETHGIRVSDDAELTIKVRIFRDLCTISVDSSGEGLHKRGYKEAVNKAPMRETLASLLLRECGFCGTEPVVDPMCGSGTFIIEAAEIAAGLQPGRVRNFAFQQLKSFDPELYETLKKPIPEIEKKSQFFGFDRDKGAIDISQQNAKRAGVGNSTQFLKQTIANLKPPTDQPGLVIINPPYGVRIGEIKKLSNLYISLGNCLKAGFDGWRVGLITNSDQLAKATALPFCEKPLKFSHGGIPVKLFKTDPLPQRVNC